ncbi:MAG: hypothetical protein ACMUHY_06835 [Thermoplasmatota archaeon]
MVERYVEDLSGKSAGRESYSIPRNVAIAIMVILSISGVMIAWILPELIEGAAGDTKEDNEARDVLGVIVASSIPDLDIAGTAYSNVPVPTAFQILFLDGDPNDDYPSMDGMLTQMMDYLLEGSSGYVLNVIPGSGMEGSDYSVGNGGSGSPDGSAVREVPVGLGDDEGTVVFELKIWGVSVT